MKTKSVCKKILIWSLVIILMVAYLPIGEIYAYTNEIEENSQQNVNVQKDKTNGNIITNESQNKKEDGRKYYGNTKCNI